MDDEGILYLLKIPFVLVAPWQPFKGFRTSELICSRCAIKFSLAAFNNPYNICY